MHVACPQQEVVVREGQKASRCRSITWTRNIRVRLARTGAWRIFNLGLPGAYSPLGARSSFTIFIQQECMKPFKEWQRARRLSKRHTPSSLDLGCATVSPLRDENVLICGSTQHLVRLDNTLGGMVVLPNSRLTD